MGDSADLEAAGQDAATMLTDIGYLTERQAEAYVYRELLGFDREGVATTMGTTKSNVDNLQRKAREKITQAAQTVDVLNELCEDE